jgi:hypothetical protein
MVYCFNFGCNVFCLGKNYRHWVKWIKKGFIGGFELRNGNNWFAVIRVAGFPAIVNM